jgi:hypothetical protein
MDKQSGGRWKERVIAGIVAAAVLGALLAGVYYHEELATYFRLHGWDTASAEKRVREFIREVHAGDPAAATMLDGDRAKPVITDHRLTAVDYFGARGPAQAKVAQLVSPAEVKRTIPRIRWVSKILSVAVEYTDGQWVEFGLDRTPNGLRIVDVSASLTHGPPIPLD